jgi:dTMP kinase
MLVTLEGLDGSGKTTVVDSLQADRPNATFTQEPTESWYGEAVRRSLDDEDADPIAELFLYTADHAAHLADVVRPALERGELVVSDRYSDSRYAYQAACLEGRIDRPLEYVIGVHNPWTRPPDATLYFDVDPETGAARSSASNKFEQATFLRSVRERYERLIDSEPERFIRIDASQSPEVVIAEAENALAELGV